MITEDVWHNVIVLGIGDAEFDWFGIDRNGYLGVFSTFNRGYIPESVKSSRTDYTKLLTDIENLPLKFKALLISKISGRYDDWLEYSQQGLIGFDYGDVHRTIYTGIYDLISKPEKLVTVSELGINSSLIDKMPKFTLSFIQDAGIDEEDLRNNTI